MNHLFVTYEIAFKLREVGFDELSLAYYTHNEKLCRIGSTSISVDLIFCMQKDLHKTYYLAPLYQQVVDWFREKHNIEIDVHHFNDNRFNWSYQIRNITSNPIDSKSLKIGTYFSSYYEALNKAVEEALKLI